MRTCGWAALAGCVSSTPPSEVRPADPAALAADNPIRPLPEPPLGISNELSDLPSPPTPERVRLGRWLFFDPRLSQDGTVSCATCHRPDHAFSEPTPVSTGVRGQKGGRKAPQIINLAFTVYPHFFWDGRAASLEEQAKGPIENPIEMGHTHEAVVGALKATGYPGYFQEAFGTPEITIERVAKAIADYERTRLSGNSAYDRWRQNEDEAAVSEQVKLGYTLFHNKAQCNQCHLGENFSDDRFHNLGIGWDEKAKSFSDLGRYEISKAEEDKGAFKTPGLREVSKHPPYMHDGSLLTLADVVRHYNKGGHPNPHLSPKIRPLSLTPTEIDAIVAFMLALEGEGYLDQAPTLFP